MKITTEVALNPMMAAMARAGTQTSMGSVDRLQSEMSHQAGELDKILAEQKKVLADTETVDEEIKQALDAESDKRLKQMMPRFQQLMEQLQPRLPSEQRDSVPEMLRMLQEGQIESFTRFLESLKKELMGQAEIRKRLDELMKETKALIPAPHEISRDDSRQSFADLFSRQANLQQRTREPSTISSRERHRWAAHPANLKEKMPAVPFLPNRKRFAA